MAEKLRGTKVWFPKVALGIGYRRGLPLTLCGSGGITPKIFLKTQMLNAAFW